MKISSAGHVLCLGGILTFCIKISFSCPSILKAIPLLKEYVVLPMYVQRIPKGPAFRMLFYYLLLHRQSSEYKTACLADFTPKSKCRMIFEDLQDQEKRIAHFIVSISPPPIAAESCVNPKH